MKQPKGLLVFLVIATVLLVGGSLLFLLGAKGFFSTVLLGEEGYQPYDPLLAGGTYDKNVWKYIMPDCSSSGRASDDCKKVTQWQGVEVVDNTLWVRPQNGAQGQGVRTRDLRLQDLKFWFVVENTVSPASRSYYGTGTLSTSTNGTILNLGSPTKTATATVELRWDDYELGHYQVFINGLVKAEGTVPEGEEFFFTIRPDNFWAGGSDTLMASAGIKSPRYKNLFDCDLQAGEVKVNTCFRGPDTVTLRDLDGFRRFCPSLPAVFTDAGVSAPSKQVYYQLASNKAVTVEDDQVWEFQYLADSQGFNVPADKTGIINTCTAVIADLKDLPIPDARVTQDTLTWTSHATYTQVDGYRNSKTTLLSGTKAFMITSHVMINEQSCPYTEEWQTYPGLPASCFTLEAFGKRFAPGQTHEFSNLKVTLQDLAVQYRLDTEDGKRVRYTATWQLTFTPSTIYEVPPVITDPDLTVSVTNALPGPALITTILTTKQASVGELDVQSYNTTLASRATEDLTVRLPAHFVGKHETSITGVLQTEYGNIRLSSDPSFTYTIIDPTTQPEETSGPGIIEGIGGFFRNLWERVRSWWSSAV